MTSSYIDHDAEARSRVAMQYTESARFLATLSALASKCHELELVLLSLKEISDIDLSQGVQLDVIGDIVGVTRYIPKSVTIPFFGFYNNGLGATVFGEEGNIAIGSRFREELESNTATTVLQDPEFRTLIRAKIYKNHSLGTPEDIIAGLNYIFNSREVYIDDSGGMKISIVLTRPVTLVEKVLIEELDILPRPNGVSLKMRGWVFTSCLGFSDSFHSVGFAEEGSTSLDHLLFEELN